MGIFAWFCSLLIHFWKTPSPDSSTLELSDRVIILALNPQNLRDNPGGAVE